MQHPENHAVLLAAVEIPGSCHACAFFHSHVDERQALLAFAKGRPGQGERGLHVVDPSRRDTLVDRLRGSSGVTPATSIDRLEIVEWDDAPSPRSIADARIARLEELLSSGSASGRTSTRLWSSMTWGADGEKIDDLLEYEARINTLASDHPCAMVCAYDLSRFNAGRILDVLRTHPQVILAGQVQDNPFYLAPDVFLAELRERRTMNLPGQPVA